MTDLRLREVSPFQPMMGGPAPVLPLSREAGFFELDRSAARRLGESLAPQYAAATPYPHIVFDNFLDRSIVQQVDAEFPNREKGRFADAFSQLKTGYSLEKIRSPYIHDLFNALNSAAFLTFLEKLTGIHGLIPDPRFNGGGLHETRRGGHLAIHADFNMHPILRLRRRINLILYLNEDWQEEWGGALELWDRPMRQCVERVVPLQGRAVIFNTDSDSWHGHPDPLECPEDVTRRSIALYYYTAPKDFRIAHTTKWRKRPGSKDSVEPLAQRIRYSLRYYFGKRESE